MQLRKHLKMTAAGYHNWPPKWQHSISAPAQLPKGEVGTLVDVKINTGPRVSAPYGIWLVIEHQGKRFVSEPLLIHDRALYRNVLALLRRHIGKTISELGEADISN